MNFLVLNGKDTKPLESSFPCRVTCTVQVPDGFGGFIGITASGGNIFTSCERAGEMACHNAMTAAFAILSRLSQLE